MLCYKPKYKSSQDKMEPSPLGKLFCWTTFIEEFGEVRATINSKKAFER